MLSVDKEAASSSTYVTSDNLKEIERIDNPRE